MGDQLGPYRITRELGAGGMGVVFEATEEGLGRRVALKVLARQLAEEPEFRARFAREATVLARSDSPHIIQVYSHGEQDGCLYLATQFVPGGDLAARVAAEGVPAPDTALDIAAQVASALADAHAVGVVHRDVKPHNVLLRPGQGQVHAYLCDFGIARDDEASLTSVGVVAGTYAYLAPERFRGEPATPASDVYALGCLLWFLLTGRAPYDGGLVQLAQQHELAPVPRLLGASAQVNEFLARAMAKDPATRHTSAAEAAADLRRIRASGALPTQFFVAGSPAPPTAPISAPSPVPSSGSPPYASAPSPVPFAAPLPPYATPVQPPPRRRRGLGVGLVALVVVAALAAGGAVLWTNRGDDDRPDERATGRAEVSDPVSPIVDEQTGTTPIVGPGARLGPVTPADVDGDGTDDTILVDNTAGQTVVLPSTADGFGDGTAWADTAYGKAKVVHGDFTGDGLTDLALVQSDRLRVARSTGRAFADPEGWAEVQLPDEFRVIAADFDGDGQTDLAFLTGAGEDHIEFGVALSDGTSFSDPRRWASAAAWTYADMKVGAGDLDGDGKADIIEMGQPREGGIDFRFFPSTGSSFAVNEGWFTARSWDWSTTRFVVGNFDGDDDADVMVLRDEGGTTLRLLRSDGTTLVDDDDPVELDGIAYADASPVAADVDGDGATDVVLLDSSSGELRQLLYGKGSLSTRAEVASGLDPEGVVVVGISR